MPTITWNTQSARTRAAEPSAGAKTTTRTRLVAIDALRGLVMLFMLVDHVREAFYAQHAVTDPMDPLLIEPALFFTRITSQICAPVFVALTGIAALIRRRTRLWNMAHLARAGGAPLLSDSLVRQAQATPPRSQMAELSLNTEHAACPALYMCP